ncbi:MULTISPECIES: serine/threonine-protein kinase [Rhodococcus]|uniref:serine/threonine-protein kinase n=1 Tax=Rhodococcus TaxID=1827 RepID=UPI00193B1CDF|nr:MULTISPECIES: serine/threonine-protein kinase [Rhodococcus]QRI79233.1 protein kinase [Rhodococcus aetherivorans]QSE62417.1 protein kinase [Rhodococcus sp. PSBB066]
MADKVELRTDDWSEVKLYPAGTKINRFTIVKPIGRGGCGTVYLAQESETPDEGVNRQVALKVLRPEIADEDLIERFKSEIEVLAQLSHSNIIDVYTQGISKVCSEDGSDTLDEGVYWFTMRYYPDGDVGQGLSPKKKFGTKRVARILGQIASALDDASSKGIFHRDVKPRNILVRSREKSDESVVLADFGIAKWIERNTALTRTHVPVGTARYSSPEQLAQKDLDGRSDQFSLACTAFELLIGRPLYHNGGNRERGKSTPNVSELRKDVPKEIDAVLRKALSKKPGDRYATCAEFARAFSEASIKKKPPGNGAGGGKEEGDPPTLPPRRTSALLVIATLLLIPPILVYFGIRYWESPRPDDPISAEMLPAPLSFADFPSADRSTPVHIKFDTTGKFYAAAGSTVKEMRPEYDAPSEESSLPFFHLAHTSGLALDEAGAVYVSDRSGSIYSHTPGATTSYMPGVPYSSSLSYHAAEGWDEYSPSIDSLTYAERALYYVRGNLVCSISLVDTAAQLPREWCFRGNIAGSISALDVAYRRSDSNAPNLIACYAGRGQIVKVDLRADLDREVIAVPGYYPNSLAVAESGDIYFTSYFQEGVFKVSSAEGVPVKVESPGGAHELIGIDRSGMLYSQDGQQVWKIGTTN